MYEIKLYKQAYDRLKFQNKSCFCVGERCIERGMYSELK